MKCASLTLHVYLCYFVFDQEENDAALTSLTTVLQSVQAASAASDKEANALRATVAELSSELSLVRSQLQTAQVTREDAVVALEAAEDKAQADARSVHVVCAFC